MKSAALLTVAMNKIIYARRESINGKITAKNCELLVPDSGGTVIIPPLKSYDVDFDGIRIIFDNALLPFKEARTVPDNDGEIAYAARQALKYFESDAAKTDLVAAALGNLLTGYVAAFCAESGFSPAVELVLSEIAKGVSDCAFTVKSCLKKLPLSSDYVRKLFKKEVGVSPTDYLLKERMSLAQQLISGGVTNRFSSYTVSQIAEACGFSEPLYFSRVFKKYFGVSPSEYGNRK